MNAFPAQYVPSYTSNAVPEMKLREIALGDGYVQRSPDGINAERLSINVVYQQRTSAVVRAVLAFLRAQGPARAFTWTAPAPFDDKERRWVVRPSPSYAWEGYDCETLSFVLEEDHNPPL